MLLLETMKEKHASSATVKATDLSSLIGCRPLNRGESLNPFVGLLATALK